VQWLKLFPALQVVTFEPGTLKNHGAEFVSQMVRICPHVEVVGAST